MPSRVQHGLAFRCLCLRLGLVLTPLCERVSHVKLATCVDIVPFCTTMARALRHGFLDGLQIEAHDMETRIITGAVRTFAEAVAPSVRIAHATSLLDWAYV
jgi:hypothetical protein